MPIENPIVFHLKYGLRSVWNQVRIGGLLCTLLFTAWKIERDPAKRSYMDAALVPATDDREAEGELEMIHTHGAAANKLQRAHIHMHDEHVQEPLVAAE
jgi:hypothetical protein